MTLQIISINYNIETGRQSSSGGTTKRIQDLPILTRRQQNVVLAIDLLRSNGNLVTDLIDSNDVFSWAADDDFNQITVPKMKTIDTGFNIPGDRPDLNPEGGKISVRLNADTAELAADLGTGVSAKRKKTYDMELQIFAFGAGNAKGIYLFDTDNGDGIIVKNILDDAGTGPAPTPVINFLTITETLVLLAEKEQLQGPAAALGVDATATGITNVFSLPATREDFARTGYTVTRDTDGLVSLPTIQWKTSSGLILSQPIAMIATEAIVGHTMVTELDNEIMIPVSDIIQAEITIAGVATTHTVDFKYNGQEF